MKNSMEELSVLVAKLLAEDEKNIKASLENGEGNLSLHQLRTLAQMGIETSLFLVGMETFHSAKKALGIENETLSSQENRLSEFADLEPKKYSVNKVAYDIWEKYRLITHKKSSTAKSKQKDYLLLRKYSHEIQTTIIEKSMGENWIGLFPPSWDKIDWKKTNRTSASGGENEDELMRAFDEGENDE